MVASTTSLNSLKKSIFSKIHQPLPLTKRESQQLLEYITASFRKNLDKEHPWQTNDDESTFTQTHSLGRSVQKQQTFSPSSSSSSPVSSLLSDNASSNRQRPTDRHLRAILSNPLFAHQHNNTSNPTKNPTPSTGIAARDPFDVFDRAVARGLMTPRRAAGFLAAVRSRIATSSPDDKRQGMAKSGAALRVVQWLRASGQENTLNFLNDLFLPGALIPFMYAEGLEEVAWTWLTRLALCNEISPENSFTDLRTLSFLLSVMMQQTSKPDFGQSKISLDTSYSSMIRASELLSPRNKQVLSSLRSAWFFLSWASTVDAWERPKPSASLFDSFIDIGRPFRVPLDMAHLELHHPLHPSHSAAVEYMHSHAGRGSQPDDVATWNLNKQTRRRLVCLAIDTAESLKRAGDPAEASWVGRFLTQICDDLNLNIFNVGGAELGSDVPIYRMN
ncbi:hypothetical protein AAE478_002105 [Parahypoxylon ruwenzoriense]